MPALWRCTCGGVNRGEYSTCVQCSAARPAQKAPAAPVKSEICPVDGGLLEANGICPRGAGWPMTQDYAPEACPDCRRWLSWSGLCLSCSRPGGWAPGHRYELQINGHWQRVAVGPTPLFTTPQNRAALSLVLAVLEKRMTEAEAHAAIDEPAKATPAPVLF